MSELFSNTAEDCQWLRDTHLSPRNITNAIPYPFRSFLLLGNEDCPEEIRIFEDENPVVTDKPAIARLEDGKYTFIL